MIVKRNWRKSEFILEREFSLGDIFPRTSDIKNKEAPTSVALVVVGEHIDINVKSDNVNNNINSDDRTKESWGKSELIS